MVYPIDRAHLYDQFKNGFPSGGRITFVWLFGIIGIFVLLLACINFMNLSTARSEKRAREVGIRKTIGSLKRQLVCAIPPANRCWYGRHRFSVVAGPRFHLAALLQ